MKPVLAVAFPIVILGIFLASFWYVAFRFRTLLELTHRWPLRITIAVVIFASLAGTLSAARSTSSLVGVWNVVGGYVFSFYVFLTLLLLVLHALQMKVALPGKWAAFSALGVALVITVAGAVWANSFWVRKIDIPLAGLSRDVVIMHISDVHIGHHRGRAYLDEIVTETNRHKPDIVLLNGDLVDSDVALLPGSLEPLSNLEAPAYFVNGNHDNYVDTVRALELISQQGVRILHNEVIDTHGISLIGLDYMNPDADSFDMHPSHDTRTIENVLPTLTIENGKPSVLMHHSPVGAQYVAAKGVDLMLSGHTHTGQMFPGTLFAPFIFAFNKGLYNEGDMKVFVSQGAGTFGPRMRLCSSNEINLIKLKAQSKGP